MYLTTKALVLRVTDYNDKDCLLTVLTPEHGKLTFNILLVSALKRIYSIGVHITKLFSVFSKAITCSRTYKTFNHAFIEFNVAHTHKKILKRTELSCRAFSDNLIYKAFADILDCKKSEYHSLFILCRKIHAAFIYTRR